MLWCIDVRKRTGLFKCVNLHDKRVRERLDCHFVSWKGFALRLHFVLDLFQIAAFESNEYRLGFTAAIMTDLFNWMTVLVLLPLEMVTGFLAHLSR